MRTEVFDIRNGKVYKVWTEHLLNKKNKYIDVCDNMGNCSTIENKFLFTKSQLRNLQIDKILN